MNLQETRAALESRGFEARICTPEEAVDFVLAVAAKSANVGWGGSETVKALGLRDSIAAFGIEIRDHRLDCDLFLLSANALLADGRIVNIDGTGNRIAASIYGPKRVIYLIGRNKLVEGGFDDAVARIRREACPPNCRRLGKKTPCSEAKCPSVAAYEAALAAGVIRPAIGRGCDSTDRICKVTVVFDAPPRNTPTTVLLIDADLGY